MNKADISVKDCNLWYGDFRALKDISIEIPANEITALIGPSGCGKSTFLKIFNRMNDLVPGCRITGNFTVGGNDIFAKNCDVTLLRKNVGMVFQNPDNQIVSNVVEEDVAFAPENLGVASQEIRQRVDDALRAVGMYDYRTYAPQLLSGGQKQRVAIARMLTKKTPIMVFDDSLSAVDTQTDEKIRTALGRDLAGTTTIIISHRITTLMDCDNVLVLERGKLLQYGPPQTLLQADGLFRQIYDMQMSIGEEEPA